MHFYDIVIDVYYVDINTLTGEQSGQKNGVKKKQFRH